MSMPMHKEINITNLLLNPENPRFNPVEYQSEIIEAMVRNQQNKLVVLARHILNYGLNPSDLIMVKPYEKQWVVQEGNRRTTVLKLLNEPSLVPNTFAKLKKDFQKLNLLISNDLLKKVPCVILEDENDIKEWVRLKHTGENDGAGTVGWDGQQTSRFKRKPDIWLSFLDELSQLKNIPKDIKDKFQNIKKTNFDRIMSDPDFRSFLGVEIIDNKLKIINNFNSYFLEVIRALANEEISVGEIYHKSDRLKYMNLLKRRLVAVRRL